jgi:hypothetical protein
MQAAGRRSEAAVSFVLLLPLVVKGPVGRAHVAGKARIP